MSQKKSTLVKSVQGDTLDLICHRHYGRTQKVTETVMAANPNIDFSQPILPLGTLVKLPVIEQTKTQETITLWSNA